MGPLELGVITGSGIDIGCGPDPITPEVRTFDRQEGDANQISQYVREQFDFVFSSHCLEHMNDPRQAVLEWWKLVKPGGHLYFLVPDEDLYEQGVFPSRFNAGHRATFTVSKAKSWSPVSVNVLDLANSLPNSRVVSLVLQDHGYDRRLMKFGPIAPSLNPIRAALRACRVVGKGLHFRPRWLNRWSARYEVVDQTSNSDTLAQIQCIVRKDAGTIRMT